MHQFKIMTKTDQIQQPGRGTRHPALLSRTSGLHIYIYIYIYIPGQRLDNHIFQQYQYMRIIYCDHYMYNILCEYKDALGTSCHYILFCPYHCYSSLRQWRRHWSQVLQSGAPTFTGNGDFSVFLSPSLFRRDQHGFA